MFHLSMVRLPSREVRLGYVGEAVLLQLPQAEGAGEQPPVESMSLRAYEALKRTEKLKNEQAAAKTGKAVDGASKAKGKAAKGQGKGKADPGPKGPQPASSSGDPAELRKLRLAE